MPLLGQSQVFYRHGVLFCLSISFTLINLRLKLMHWFVLGLYPTADVISPIRKKGLTESQQLMLILNWQK